MHAAAVFSTCSPQARGGKRRARRGTPDDSCDFSGFDYSLLVQSLITATGYEWLLITALACATSEVVCTEDLSYQILSPPALGTLVGRQAAEAFPSLAGVFDRVRGCTVLTMAEKSPPAACKAPQRGTLLIGAQGLKNEA